MAKENAILDKKEQWNEDLNESFDFDELEENPGDRPEPASTLPQAEPAEPQRSDLF